MIIDWRPCVDHAPPFKSTSPVLGAVHFSSFPDSMALMQVKCAATFFISVNQLIYRFMWNGGSWWQGYCMGNLIWAVILLDGGYDSRCVLIGQMTRFSWFSFSSIGVFLRFRWCVVMLGSIKVSIPFYFPVFRWSMNTEFLGYMCDWHPSHSLGLNEVALSQVKVCVFRCHGGQGLGL